MLSSEKSPDKPDLKGSWAQSLENNDFSDESETIEYRNSIGNSSSETSSMERSSCNKLIKLGFKSLNIGFAILMIATAIESLMTLNEVREAGRVFVATYMIFFAFLLLAIEAIEVHRSEKLNFLLQRNFGFLFSVIGKPLFIIFIAFLNFGLNTSLGLITGLLLLFDGVFQIVLFLKYPETLESLIYQKANSVETNSSSV